MPPKKLLPSRIQRFFSVLLLLTLPSFAFCLSSPSPTQPGLENGRGLPFIQNFNPADYLHLTAHFEHSAIIQDQRGVVMIGSHGGVLLYNGNTWQLVETPGRSMVWSLGKDDSGRVYVGASDNLGYLAPDSEGKTRFVSLLPYLPKEVQPVGEVWATVVTPEGVYFKSNGYLMRWHQNQFKVWKAETAFGPVQWINGKLYIQLSEKGLFVLQHDNLELFSQDPVFSQNWLRFLLPLTNQKWLVGTFSNGLYFFENQRGTPVSNSLNTFLIANNLFSGILLPDSSIGIGTLKGGVVVMDQQANIKTLLNKESGLVTNTVYSLSTDNQGGLWIGQEKGLSRVRLASPFSYFNERNGLLRQTYAMTWHGGQLYAGTTDGLFVLEPKSDMGATSAFRKITAFTRSIWQLQSVGGSLLIASDEGLFEWQNGKITSMPITDNPYDNFCQDIQSSLLDSSLVFAASKGLYAFRRVGNSWKKEGHLPGLEEGLYQILESPKGDLWLTTQSGVVRVRFPGAKKGSVPQGFFTTAVVDRFGKRQGLPSGSTRLYRVGDQLMAQVGEGNYQLFRFREDQNTFEPIANYGSQFGLAGQMVHPASEYSDGQNLWLWTQDHNDPHWKLKLASRQETGGYTVKHFDFSGVTPPLKHFFYQQSKEAVWFAGIDGLVRFDWPATTLSSQPFRTVLERIVLPSDSVLYPSGSLHVQLPYGLNSLRFEFAAPSYNGTEDNTFQYWLEGYHEGWSDWTPESFKEYTRIPEGNYTFRVRAVNAQGQLGEPAAYTFTILPPWYRSGLMYVVYLLLVGGGVYGLIRWRSSRLEAEKEQLEAIVAQRTEEVALQNEQLSQQTEELAMQAEKLKELDGVKSRFFANISHEFRTPLTLILNNLLDKLTAATEQSATEQVPVGVRELKVMSRNAQRLLQLINQLLDLSKLESGNMQLVMQDGDLTGLLKVVFASFSSLAEHQHVQFRLQVPEKSLICQFDEDKLEKILYNLLSNAFKFTPNGEEVQLQLEPWPAELTPSGIRLTVQDSGPGLTADQLEKVFDRFYQGKQHYADSQGTGIGLALTRELVELHGGKIWAESQPGQGARFIVELPFIPAAGADGPVQTTADPIVYDPNFEVSHPAIVNEEIIPADGEEWPLVLVVEDNEDLRAYIKAHLSDKYRVLESGNGTQGLAMAQDLMPDLIISDWMMPEMDGIELCERLKTDQRTSHIPVIMLTALATGDSKLKGLETGADEYLTKPFDSRELGIRIHNLIQSRRKLRDYFSREVRLEPTKMVVASVDEKFLKRVMQIVEERMGDSEFSVDEFSREVGMSRVHLHRKLKTLTDQSASDFIRMMRLKRAAQLLEAQAGNIAEIAYQVGFNNLSYFSKCFREQFGVLPSEYLNRQPASS